MIIPDDPTSAFLFGLCCGINADHKITQAEAKAFIEILRHCPSLLEAPIFAPHKSALSKLTKREELWRSHLEQAEEIIYTVLGTTKQAQAEIDAPKLTFDAVEPGAIRFANTAFVFTGEFQMGRGKVEEIAEHLGAIVQGSTNFETSYVVIGSIPSPAWKFGKFGTKVSRALELRERNGEIKIITEENFCRSLPEDILNAPEKLSPALRVTGFHVIAGGTQLG